MKSEQIWLLESSTATPATPSVGPIILAVFVSASILYCSYQDINHEFKLPLIFATTLFSAIDVGKLFWIICEPNAFACVAQY